MVGGGRYINKNKTKTNIRRGSLASSFLEALVSGARPMEIVASTEFISVSNVFVLFYYLLWKAKRDLTALSERLDSWSINVSFSTGFIASCGVMKTPSCIIRATILSAVIVFRVHPFLVIAHIFTKIG